MGLLPRDASAPRLFRSLFPESATRERRESYKPTSGDGDLYSVARVQAPSDVRDSLSSANVLFRARVIAWPRAYAWRNYAFRCHEIEHWRLPAESRRCTVTRTWATAILLVGFERGKGEAFERFS